MHTCSPPSVRCNEYSDIADPHLYLRSAPACLSRERRATEAVRPDGKVEPCRMIDAHKPLTALSAPRTPGAFSFRA